jgi:diguanylate cyclase (GGDEF)-like protein
MGADDAENARLAALRRYCVLDTAHEARFDDLTRLAASICGTPVALIGFVDAQRLFFKSAHGINLRELPHPDGFCGHAIRQRDVLEVPDALEDPRFAAHPLVTEPPRVRFYAGAPLVTDDGHAIGTLCAIDFEPRRLGEGQRDALRLLARQVMVQLDLCLETLSDPLTGLYNRRPLEHTLEREILRALRSFEPVGVMAIDIDRFKRINDTQGHDTGDAVLRAAARVFAACVRKEDVVCRAGGDEFVIILPGMGEQGLRSRAEKLREELSRTPIRVGEDTVRVTVSIGVAAFPEDGAAHGELLRAADSALYQAKALGRDRVAFRAVTA